MVCNRLIGICLRRQFSVLRSILEIDVNIYAIKIIFPHAIHRSKYIVNAKYSKVMNYGLNNTATE